MNTFLKMAWTVTLLFILPNFFYGQAPNLGTTSNFALFTGTGAFNGVTGISTVTGDIGTNTGAHAFTGILNGAAHWGDAVAVLAAADVGVAYSSFPGGGSVIGVGLGGQSLVPGVYAIGAASTLNGVLTLNGENDPNAVFVIKIDGALDVSAGSSVLLINGANLCNVYFRVNGAFSMGMGSSFSGTVVASGAINLGFGATLSGRGLSTAGAINMNSNTVTLNCISCNVPDCTITGDNSICQGQSTELCAPAGASSYLWSNGVTSRCIMVSAAGTYSVTVTDDGCTNTCSRTVTVSPLPDCTITGDASLCQGQTSQLCVPAGASSYLWSTGATTNCVTVSLAGTYSVTVTNADGCTNICSRTVTVSPLPDCTITGDSSLCQGQTEQLCVPAGAFSYLWSTGATTNCISVSLAGTYSVTVTNADGCTNICSRSVTVNPLPDCTITGDDAICEGQTSQLCVPLGAASYLWSTGATTNCITVSTGGTFSVTVTSSNGCTSVCSKTVSLDLAPTASVLSADGPVVFCEPDSVILSGNNGGTWSTGATTPTITVKTSGDYFVTTSNSCDTLISNHILVTVNPLPVPSVISADGPTSICIEDSVILTGNNGGIWSTGATTVSITVKTAGDYFVTNMNICDTVTSNHILITVDTLLTVDSIFAGGSTTFCVEDSVILSGNDGGTWSTGDTSATIIVKTSGEYFVFKANSCDSVFSNIISVTVIQLPEPATITAGGDTTFCEGDSVVLSGNIGGIWNTGDTTTSITVKTSGEFYVINNNICDSVASNRIVVTVVELPTDNAGVDDTICKGQSITLGGPPTPGHTYSWSPSGGLSSTTISNPVATTGVTKKYTLIETITGLGCQATSTVTITVSPYPSCVIKGNSKICEGQTTTLCTAAGPGYTYLWSNGDTTRCIEVSDPGRYTVTVTNAMGCSSICGQTVISGEGPCEITGNSDIFDGNTTVLCATSGYASYLWSTGATTPCITVGGAGSYSVTLTTSNGCVSVCSKTVNVIPFLCEIQIDTICATLYTLCAPEAAGNTYYWTSGGQISRCITVDCSGNYGVRVTNGRLSSTCSVYINAKVWGPRAQTTWNINGNLTPSQGQISTLCAPFGFSEYHWSNGAKTQCINVKTSGFYGVNFSYKTGCSGSAGATVNYSSSRRASQAVVPPVVVSGNVEVRAYPNPFKQSAVFEVQNNESDAHVTIELCDLTGMKVARVFDADVVRGTRYTTVFDAGRLADGIYFYRYVSGDQVISRKLILMK